MYSEGNGYGQAGYGQRYNTALKIDDRGGQGGSNKPEVQGQDRPIGRLRFSDQEGDVLTQGQNHVGDENEDKKRPGEEFDQWVDGRDGGSALATGSAKQEPTEQGYIVVPGDRVLAAGAV